MLSNPGIEAVAAQDGPCLAEWSVRQVMTARWNDAERRPFVEFLLTPGFDARPSAIFAL